MVFGRWGHSGGILASMLASVAAESVDGIGELSLRVPRARPFSFQQDEARRRIVTGMPRRHGREAMRRYGLGRARILEELGRLGTRPGFPAPSEYFIYRLYEPDRSQSVFRRLASSAH
jgi:hypothetical protein